MIVVGSYIVQYSEINLFIWTGTLLLPMGLMTFLFVAPKLFSLKNTSDSFSKKLYTLVTVYFFLFMIRRLFIDNSLVLISTNILFDFARIYLPFYGLFILHKKHGALIKHVKYNAYISLFICFGYIVVMFSDILLININSIRNVMFWNMPIGAFSSVAFWSLFYFVSKLVLDTNKKRIYLYLILLLPTVVILFSQSRGLVPSIVFGLLGILFLLKNAIKVVFPLTISIFIIFLFLNSINLNINREEVSITEIYYNRFEKSSNRNIITNDSRYSLWQDAVGSIIEHPFGGASISSKIGVHNFYLEMLMHFGIFGLLYMIILFLDLKYLVKFIHFIKRLDNKNLLIIAGTTFAIFSHALVAGLLSETYTDFYWSIAMLIILRKEIINNLTS